MRGKVHHLFARSKHYLTTFNLFPSVPPSTDEHELGTQRISTRLFIVIFITSLVVLLFYTSLIRITKSITVKAPSFDQYSKLNSTYSQTLTCPCSQISIKYGKFIHVEYTLHQVCSSIFVSPLWIYSITDSYRGPVYSTDFRVVGSSLFQSLRALCMLINSTIFNSLIEFYSNEHVSAFVIPEQLLKSEIESLTDRFRSSVINSFSSSLAMIRTTTQANVLHSSFISNYQVYMINVSNVAIAPKSHGSCNCRSSSTCIQLSAFYHHPNSSSLFDVPDFYIGCYTIESLLQSSLKCFYDQWCIDKLQSYILSRIIITVVALDKSVSSLYSVNSTIQKLVDNLMIEEWNVLMMYETYYNECQPIQCSYKVARKNDVIYIVTTLFGIAGGLTTTLKLIVPRLVKLARKKRGRQQQALGKM